MIKQKVIKIDLVGSILEGYAFKRKIFIPGKNSTGAIISVPKKFVGNYLVVLIPAYKAGDSIDELEL